MIVQTSTLHLKTQGFCHVVDITGAVAKKVTDSSAREGAATVFVMGSTAGVTTIEYEPGLVQDLETLFEELAPQSGDYQHEALWHDGNGFSHVRAALLKPSLVVPFSGGKLTLGTWQQIVVVDFDNRPRDRSVAVQIMGSK